MLSNATQPVSKPFKSYGASLDSGVALSRWCIDVSIALLLFVAPLVLGGRHPVGKLVFIAAALPGTIGIAIKVTSGRSLPLTRWQLFLLLGCFLVPAVQVAEISPAVVPASAVSRAAPGIDRLFGDAPPLVSKDNLQRTLSVSPATTIGSIPIIVAYLCIFVFLVVRIESRADVERLLTLLTGSALMLAVLALLQANFGNNRFLWLYDHPDRWTTSIPRGPFQNENHLCSLLATTLPCLLYFLFRAADPVAWNAGQIRRGVRSGGPSTLAKRIGENYQRWLAAVTAVVIVSSVYATPSRGGAAIVAVAGTIWFAILAWNWVGTQYMPHLRHATWMRLGGVCGCVCSILGVVYLYGVIQKYCYWRAKIWQVDLQIWRDFPLFGIGVGNHRHVYRGYVDEYSPQTFSTSESSWLQFLVETGGLGMALAVASAILVLLAALWAVTQFQRGSALLLSAAVLAGLLASCLHAVGDFPWHIPACFVVVLVLAACALRLPKAFDLTHSPELTPSVSMAVAGALLLGNVWAVSKSLPAAHASVSWDAYRRLVRDQPELESNNGLGEATQLLQETLRRDPTHVLARVTLIWRLTAEFERERVQVRDPENVAKNILLQCSILAGQCPTESRTYLCATVAAATLGMPVEQQQRLLEQSQRLRLVDGRVALRRGLNALILQDPDLAYEQFAVALNADPSFRKFAVEALTMLFSVEQIIENCRPAVDAAGDLYRRARETDQPPQHRFAGHYYCCALWDQAQQGQDVVESMALLQTAFDVATEIEDHRWGLKIVSKQLTLEPSSVNLLLARAELCHQLGEMEQAHADVARCLRLSPLDDRVRRLSLQIDREQHSLRR